MKTHVIDLLDKTGIFLSMDTLKKKFSIKTNHVTYSGLRMTILADLNRYHFCRNDFIIRY